MELNIVIERCKKNDRIAQAFLYNTYSKILYNISLKYCSSKFEAEDNLQESFIEIFTSIKKYRGEGSFEGWIKRITLYKAINRYKKDFKTIPINEELILNPHNDEEFDISKSEININDFLKIIQELPPQYRVVFNLYYLDNYSHSEIADLLNISIGTSKSNLHRAKNWLNDKFKLKKNKIELKKIK